MGAEDVDISLYKKFSIGEKKELRFEVSSYNIANRAQFGMPNVPAIAQVGSADNQGPAILSLRPYPDHCQHAAASFSLRGDFRFKKNYLGDFAEITGAEWFLSLRRIHFSAQE